VEGSKLFVVVIMVYIHRDCLLDELFNIHEELVFFRRAI
tara:strand:- start:40 stop:156 length:117 start_codon:yes stop_codon:yes gene_type:complete